MEHAKGGMIFRWFRGKTSAALGTLIGVVMFVFMLLAESLLLLEHLKIWKWPQGWVCQLLVSVCLRF